MRWSQILVGNRDFCLPHLDSMPPLGGPRRNIAMMFGMEKLEWCGYPIVKNFWRYVSSFRQNTQTWQTDGQAHGRTDTTSWHRLCLHSIVWQKLQNYIFRFYENECRNPIEFRFGEKTQNPTAFEFEFEICSIQSVSISFVSIISVVCNL